ncbi:MAG: type I-F CRISPR-associated helicase Cas3f, partial [Aeromonas sp.]
KTSLKGPYDRLDALEHAHLYVRLFGYQAANKTPEIPPAQQWWQCPVDWSGEMQQQTPFRHSHPDEGFVLYQKDQDEPLRFHRLEAFGEPTLVDANCFVRSVFTPAMRVEPLLSNDPEPLLAAMGEQLEWDAARLSRTFTEIRLRKTSSWLYDPLFGVYQALT